MERHWGRTGTCKAAVFPARWILLVPLGLPSTPACGVPGLRRTVSQTMCFLMRFGRQEAPAGKQGREERQVGVGTLTSSLQEWSVHRSALSAGPKLPSLERPAGRAGQWRAAGNFGSQSNSYFRFPNCWDSLPMSRLFVQSMRFLPSACSPSGRLWDLGRAQESTTAITHPRHWCSAGLPGTTLHACSDAWCCRN